VITASTSSPAYASVSTRQHQSSQRKSVTPSLTSGRSARSSKGIFARLSHSSHLIRLHPTLSRFIPPYPASSHLTRSDKILNISSLRKSRWDIPPKNRGVGGVLFRPNRLERPRLRFTPRFGPNARAIALIPLFFTSPHPTEPPRAVGIDSLRSAAGRDRRKYRKVRRWLTWFSLRPRRRCFRLSTRARG
jgi:hypothetical protein